MIKVVFLSLLMVGSFLIRFLTIWCSFHWYKPITLTNFKFKVITKVIVDKLATITPSIISTQQRGFIHGKQIFGWICLTSETVSVMQHKTLEKNMTLKIDNTKAFDIVDYKLLLKVLQRFDFTLLFVLWVILFFIMPGSIFALMDKYRFFHAKWVLNKMIHCHALILSYERRVTRTWCSRCITKLVNDENLTLINNTRCSHVPSHVLYIGPTWPILMAHYNLKNEFKFKKIQL